MRPHIQWPDAPNSIPKDAKHSGEPGKHDRVDSPMDCTVLFFVFVAWPRSVHPRREHYVPRGIDEPMPRIPSRGSALHESQALCPPWPQGRGPRRTPHRRVAGGLPRATRLCHSDTPSRVRWRQIFLFSLTLMSSALHGWWGKIGPTEVFLYPRNG
jgi:hypothetical protein